MSELMTHIQKSLPEELEGVMHYAEMAKIADAEGKHGEAGVFRDMAREEFCHAKHLKMMIHDHRRKGKLTARFYYDILGNT